MNIQCVAIDDEPLALNIIEAFCKRREDISLTTFSSAQEGHAFILKTRPQIVFLDIEMGDISGINIASKLPKEISIIFTTAYINYAIDGFNIGAADYLHKPFSYSRFNQAVDRAIQRFQFINYMTDKKQIIVKQDYNNVPIALADILYIEAMENYCKIYLKDKRMVLAHNTMKNIMEQLWQLPQGQSFGGDGDKQTPTTTELIRIHKSYIVPRTQIKSFTKQIVTLKDGTNLPVGRQYGQQLFSAG